MGRRFVVIGIGGAGSWFTAGLARSTEFKEPGSGIVLVDGDSYEPKNLARQDFQNYGNKAVATAETLSAQFSQTFFVPLPKWVVEEIRPGEEDNENKITAKDLLKEGDTVYCLVDNFAARATVFKAAKEFDNIDIFTGGNDEALYGSIYHYRRRDGADVTDHPELYHPELVDPPDRNPGELSCQERLEIEGATQLLVSNMAVAVALLALTHQYVFGDEPLTVGEAHFDLGLFMMAGIDRRVEPTSTQLTTKNQNPTEQTTTPNGSGKKQARQKKTKERTKA